MSSSSMGGVLALGVLGVLAAGFTSRKPSDSGSADDEPRQPSSGASGQKLVRELAERGGLTDRQTDFLVFVAYGESGLKPDVGLGNPALFPPGTRPNTRASQASQEREARIAAKAYAENIEMFEGCGHPASEYSFGSGGLFAFLPVYALAKFQGTPLVCASPAEVFDPSFAIAAAYGFARGLTQRSAYLGTVASLRSGWGLPSRIGDLERIERKSPKWRRQLRELGFPESMLDSEAPSFPRRDLVAMYRAMGGRL